MGDRCVPLSVLLPCTLIPLAVFCVLGVCLYVEKKKREADSIWTVNVEDLHFDEPPQVVGQGTFGLVLLAEYRGTQVAVKRVLPKDGANESKEAVSLFDSTEDHRMGLDMDQYPTETSAIEFNNSRRRVHLDGTRSSIMLAESFSGKHSQPFGGSSSQTPKWSFSKFFRSRTDHDVLKAEFMEEMRLLSKLRHPCITTVMGAVVSKTEDPMLVMEFMYHGSLYDVLHNETMVIEGPFVLHILQDIAKGMRFLHAAEPKVIHGDLKAANVLVDSKFRAKVTDFGLSQRKDGEFVSGTPFWMPPELLRGETMNTAESDMYSFGMVFYELYSRKDPYDGEHDVEVLKQVCDPNINKRPPVPASCPPEIAKLMKSLLLSDPARRPDASQLDSRLKELDVANVDPGDMQLSHRLKKEQPLAQRSDMIYQVFPRHVADVLLSGGKPEPENHEIITIFFSDVVRFTTIAAALTPLKVSNMLDRLYLVFDDLARKHHVFKIETVGDAFMCAGNLTSDQSQDHVKRIAEFAVEAIAATSHILIDEDDRSLGHIQIRAGFHSGPVVSHVVGSLNPRYGVFGDTVNVSSRMESTSEPGRIQCSERSALLLRAQAKHLPVELRGETTIKGKGTMKTYWVGGEA